jgi:hypothetical protein
MERRQKAGAEGARVHPRPQFRRPGWSSLDGSWDLAIDDGDARWAVPDEVTFDRRIVVPFAPETTASGIGDTGYYRAVW